MEITYQRSLHKSYMCIEAAEDVIEEHELVILSKYKVPQLLPLQIMIQDGRVQYWYEITGKQQLTDYLGGKRIGSAQLKKLLFSMEQVCRKIPEFLLKETRICLQSELLYVDLEDETVYFTYLPFQEEEFPREFQRWMEEVLTIIDHQDRAGAELAYDIYEKSRAENISMPELLEGIRGREISNIPEVSERKTVEQEKEISLAVEKKMKQGQAWRLPESLVKDKAALIKEKIWEKIEGYRKIFSKDEKQKTAFGLSQDSMTEVLGCQSENYHTELLRKQPEKPEGKLIYQGKNGCADFCIGKEEFFIGRNSQLVDGRIETDGISRIHARVMKSEGEYYIEDLDSTNGTYLNGKLLEYRRGEKLHKSDRVQFGTEEYVFY